MQALSLKVSINQNNVEFCDLDDKLVKIPYIFPINTLSTLSLFVV